MPPQPEEVIKDLSSQICKGESVRDARVRVRGMGSTLDLREGEGIPPCAGSMKL